jgi:hypothetical protein
MVGSSRAKIKGAIKQMSKKQLVTKREALKLVVDLIDRPGVEIQLDHLIELLTWQTKLTLWLLKDKAAAN